MNSPWLQQGWCASYTSEPIQATKSRKFHSYWSSRLWLSSLPLLWYMLTRLCIWCISAREWSSMSDLHHACSITKWYPPYISRACGDFLDDIPLEQDNSKQLKITKNAACFTFLSQLWAVFSHANICLNTPTMNAHATLGRQRRVIQPSRPLLYCHPRYILATGLRFSLTNSHT